MYKTTQHITLILRYKLFLRWLLMTQFLVHGSNYRILLDCHCMTLNNNLSEIGN